MTLDFQLCVRFTVCGNRQLIIQAQLGCSSGGLSFNFGGRWVVCTLWLLVISCLSGPVVHRRTAVFTVIHYKQFNVVNDSECFKSSHKHAHRTSLPPRGIWGHRSGLLKHNQVLKMWKSLHGIELRLQFLDLRHRDLKHFHVTLTYSMAGITKGQKELIWTVNYTTFYTTALLNSQLLRMGSFHIKVIFVS